MSSTKRGECLADILIYLCIGLIFFGLLTVQFLIQRKASLDSHAVGIDQGYNAGVRDMQQKAVEAGVAEFYVVDQATGKVAFRFREGAVIYSDPEKLP